MRPMSPSVSAESDQAVEEELENKTPKFITIVIFIPPCVSVDVSRSDIS